ncbi:hypothetical protein CDAR_454701 [Caerostris darwini]|uniref:Uncharacterized protein n=1 Tax=Caerostris darwini TaxID=1538125 RepID=A0AAV4TZ13_9ARAC|nr:hypothetical protein CDAR_454701 [Caerostris darwini]
MGAPDEASGNQEPTYYGKAKCYRTDECNYCRVGIPRDFKSCHSETWSILQKILENQELTFMGRLNATGLTNAIVAGLAYKYSLLHLASWKSSSPNDFHPKKEFEMEALIWRTKRVKINIFHPFYHQNQFLNADKRKLLEWTWNSSHTRPRLEAGGGRGREWGAPLLSSVMTSCPMDMSCFSRFGCFPECPRSLKNNPLSKFPLS